MSRPLKFCWRTGFSILLLVVMNPITQADGADDKVRAEIKAACDEIVAVKLNREKYQSGNDPKAAETFAWLYLAYGTHELFNKAMEHHSDHCELFINTYLDEALSRPGPEGFRLILAAEGVLFSIEPTKRIMARGETWLKCSRASAKYQVHLLANDRKKGAALYQFVVWRKQYFRTDRMYSRIEKAVEKVRNKEDFFWNGRNFALLAMATGREDLVHGLEEENMSSRCSLWARWIGLQFTILRPSSVGSFWYVAPQVDVGDPWSKNFELEEMLLPATPLPNWSGEVLELTGHEMPNHS